MDENRIKAASSVDASTSRGAPPHPEGTSSALQGARSNASIRTYEERYETVTVEEVERWMKEQPLGLRRLEQHERVRLKIAG